jgi:hypothetical protein
MGNKKTLINFLLTLVIAVACVWGCSDANSDNKTSPAKDKPADSAPASISINAGKLVLEFEGNEVRANQIYGGKRVRVNGTVNSIEVLNDGGNALTFHSPAGGYAQTQCHFDNSQSSRLAELSGGQEATVEGTVRGIGGGMGGKGFVVLEDCLVP